MTGGGEFEDGGGGVNQLKTSRLKMHRSILHIHMCIPKGGHPSLTPIIIFYMEHYGRSRCLMLDFIRYSEVQYEDYFCSHGFIITSRRFLDENGVGVPLVSPFIHG